MANIKSSRKPTKFYTPTRKKLLILVAVILVAGGVLFVLEKKKVTNLTGSEKTADETAGTTSTADTAQEDYADGNEREPGNALDDNSGGITDNNGNVGNNTDTSNPIVSSTGEISLYAPKQNALVESGDEVAGSSTLTKVSYRIIDSIAGVIATGELTVVNGKFSGKISYSSSASEGRLDIFGTKPDGVEFSNIEVPIRLN